MGTEKLERGYRVNHFSTGHIGGAGLAARRLSATLNSSGQVSHFYALSRHDFEPEQNEFAIKRSLLKRIQSGLLSRLQTPFANKTLFTPLSISAISTRFFEKNFDKTKDIIHFHNWYNLVSLKTILNLDKAGFKVFLTLHDQRFMTAGCHYSFECVGFQHACNKCPLLPPQFSPLLEIKFKGNLAKYHESHGITIIAPSEWIRNQALVSNATNQMKVFKVENVLGPEWSNSIERILALRENRQTKDVYYVGIASMDPESYIKGGDIIERLQTNYSVQKNNVLFVNLKDATKTIDDFWGKIDLLLVPSRADNSPNVILEAKSLNIPVLASSVGGIPEMMQNDSGSLFSIDFDSDDEIINKILARKMLPTKAENLARDLSDLEALQGHLFHYSRIFHRIEKENL